MKNTLKRFISTALVVLMVLTSAPFGTLSELDFGWLDFKAKAATTTTVGQCGEDLFWEFDEETGAVVISGTGELYDSRTFEYKDDIKTVYIPDSVTRIPFGFLQYSSVEEVLGGKNVVEANSCAFYSCRNLRKVDFIENLERVFGSAFEHTAIGGDIEFNKEIYIYPESFIDCGNIESVKFNSSAHIYSSAFEDCVNISEFIFPEKNAEVSFYFTAFWGCSSLETLHIPETVKEIYCEDRNSVGETGKTADSFKSITVSENSNYFSSDENGALYDKDKKRLLFLPVKSGVKDFVMPNTVELIEKCAFAKNPTLETVTISTSAKTIDNFAFYSCTALKKITIPDSVTKIGEYAFSYCSGLKTAIIGKNVSEFPQPFYGCYAFTSILVKNGNTTFYSDSYGALYNSAKKELLLYPAASSNKSFTMASFTETVYTEAFANAKNLESVSFSANVKDVYSSAFLGCSSLKTVNFASAQITEIPYNCFENCTSLESIAIPEGVTNIGSNSFKNCVNLKTVSLPSTLKTIETGAFEDCESVTELNLPDSLEEIKSKAFFNCKSVKTIYFGSKVSSISSDALLNCTSVERYSVSSSNTSFLTDSYGALYNKNKTDLYAFPNNSTCTSYEVPEGVTTLAVAAFVGNKNLKTIKLPSTLIGIGQTSVTYPTGYKYYGSFSDCSALEKIEVASNNNTFYAGSDGVLYSKDMTKLHVYPSAKKQTTFTIPASVKTIYEYTFSNCINLSRIEVEQGNTNFISDEYGVLYNVNNKLLVYPDGKTESEYTIADTATASSIYAFTDAYNLKTLIIPESFTATIPSFAFTTLEHLYILNPNATMSSAYRIKKDITIHSYLGSEVQKYCKEKGIAFEPYNHTHEYTTTVLAEATCTTDGKQLLTCYCEYSFEQVIPALGHKEETLSEKDPTCEDSGLTMGIKCTTCNEIVVEQQVIAPTGHNYLSEVITAPTCTEKGVIKYTCHCADTYTEEIKATGHKDSDSDDWCDTCNEYISTLGITGTCGENVKWNFNEETGVLVISGKGDMDLISSEDTPWYTYKDSIESVIIGEGVTSVGAYAFSDCGSLTSVTIPDGVIKIGTYAFLGCKGITSITIPSSLKSIGFYAFDDCKKLTDIYYKGTKTQWKAISIGHSNSSLENAKIYYNWCGDVHKAVTTVPQQEPTCTEIGYTQGEYCSACNYWLSGHEEIEAINHKNKTTYPQQDATCTEKGFTAGEYCPDCDTWLSGYEEIEAINHKNKITYPQQDATCTEKGFTAGEYCPDCKTWLSGHEGIEAINHKNKTTYKQQDATCTEVGFTAGEYCPDCDTWLSGHEGIEATNHKNKTTHEQQDATCTEVGFTAGEYCPDCKTWLSGHEGIEAINHKNKITYKQQDATCTEVGFTAGEYCPDCKTWLSGHKGIEATGHTYTSKITKNPTCTETGVLTFTCHCTDTYIEEIPSLEHDFSTTFTIDKEASCTKEGSKSKYCTRNGCTAKTSVTAIAATGHSYGSYKTTKSASCTATGSNQRTCSACGNTETTTIAKLGHSYSTTFTVDTPATCTTAGSKSKHCTRTGCTAKTSVTAIAATGHSYGSYKTIKSATCTAVGSKQRTCSVCNNVDTATITKLGHSYSSSYTTDKKATCTTDGSKSKHCTRTGCTAKTSVTAIAKLGHKYDNACDKECNTCKTTRSITHSYKATTTKATLSKNGKVVNKCSVCGYSKTTTIYYPKTIKLSATSYTYNGKTKTPTVTIKDSNGNILKKDTDYTVKYADGRKNAGKYSVTVTFKGKYSGTKTLYFKILPSKTSKITPTCATTSIKATWSKVTGASGYRVQLLDSKGKVVKSATTTSTSYTFKSLSKVTTYKVRVTAYKTIDKKAVYSTVSTTITTSTAPAAVTLSKVTAGSKSATPTWKTVSGASGYQVMYSTSSKFSDAKKVSVKGASTVKSTIKNLTSNKTYYFKVRAFKTADGKNVYGDWSAVKSVKVK